MTTTRSRTADLLAYGALGLPLAFAALPLYVHVPRLYAGLGLSLATVGAVLMAARVVDALTDPLIGWSVDRVSGRRKWIAAALPVLGLGMIGLLSPPADAGALWLLALLVLVSLAYSVATIAYNAWGAEVAPTPDLRTRYVASREGFALFGVMLAAVLPTVLAAGLALPLATLLGYTPGARGPDALRALSIVYAVLPVVLKLAAIVLLWRWRHVLEPQSALAQALPELPLAG